MSIWDALRHGFTPVYWLTISGVPVVWIERAQGLSLPAEFTVEAEGLSIDDSAEIGTEIIDRERGLSVSLPLSFKLLDTSTARDWIRRWSKSMTLTADLLASGTTLTVDDSTGWSNGEGAFLGLERIQIGTVASSTSLTGCLRDTAGSLAYHHRTGTTAQIVTDRPRFWRGRDVTLWASPCDATGQVTGGNLQADAVIVWRGRLDSGPEREVDGFRFEALSLDRVLDGGLAGSVTGTVTDTSARFAVASGWSFTVQLNAVDSGGSEVWGYTLTGFPFGAYPDGELLSGGKIRELIQTAWTAAVVAAGATLDLSDLVWEPHNGGWEARVEVVDDDTIRQIHHWLLLDGQDVTNAPDATFPIGMPLGDVSLHIGWTTGDDPRQVVPKFTQSPIVQALTVQLDEGSVADVPDTGLLRITIGDQVGTLQFAYKGTSQGNLYLGGITPAAGKQTGLLTAKAVLGASVELLAEDEGTLPAMMLRCLHSSGTTALRDGTYDTLDRGQGYGLPTDLVLASSFTAAPAPLGTLQAKVQHGGKGFGDLFGGSLGLFRHAVVLRPDLDASYRAPKLTLVCTAPFGSGWSTTITDADLLADEGDPVVSVKRADAANVVAVTRPLPDGESEDRLVFADQPTIEAEGRREVEYQVPALSRDALWYAAMTAATSQLAADQTVQAVELLVGPWVAAEPGDIVQLELTSPALWTWSTSPGQVGYTGPGRVVGRRLNPKTCTVILTVLLDGALQVRALSPSAEVQAFDHATAPTTIDVPLPYLQHFEDALADAGGPIWVYHYKPGQTETVGQRHQVSQAVESGGLCRLTVVANPTGHTLSTATATPSYLTLPTTTGGHVADYQETFAHVGDGTQWG